MKQILVLKGEDRVRDRIIRGVYRKERGERGTRKSLFRYRDFKGPSAARCGQILGEWKGGGEGVWA